ncbi:DUF6776 family protein [Pleionea sp. CnH1-48]|uniref:DUF6776 family protein n=1 Tax=Pleionea sp. CnH1-48 TaxID=2954494 RepID=UPI0020982B1C|nr:DUF6776 family protein [Pleionea sp. CnH1-48]MCO7227321.1 hypothetical protein [Pleionea sp. CnH1-48]
MTQGELIITQRRGAGWYIAWSLVFLIALTVMFFLGRLDSQQERTQLMNERDILNAQVDDLDLQLKEAQQKVVMLDRSAQVDAQASEEIMETITGLQQNIDNLEKELSFYRGIMAPELDVKGLHVNDFILEPLVTNGRYRFQLALTQVKSHKSFLQGRVTIAIEGSLNGKDTVHNMTELSSLTEKDMKFQFKYFQHIKGQFSLPEGFKPTQVIVNATTSGRKSQTIKKAFPWSV